jgi:hypothetical protein
VPTRHRTDDGIGRLQDRFHPGVRRDVLQHRRERAVSGDRSAEAGVGGQVGRTVDALELLHAPPLPEREAERLDRGFIERRTRRLARRLVSTLRATERPPQAQG